MWPRLRWGWWAIVAILSAMAAFAIAECATGNNAQRNCENRGGRVDEYDCPEPRRWCTSTGRSTSCVDRSCKWRCVEPAR